MAIKKILTELLKWTGWLVVCWEEALKILGN